MTDIALTLIDRDGGVHSVAAAPGAVLMEVMREEVDVTIGTCGGQISCGTCLVKLSPEWLAIVPPALEDEAEMLDALDATPDARLSCQLIVDAAADGMSATIAPAD